eukprot:5647915-Amphidinium_carterae.3
MASRFLVWARIPSSAVACKTVEAWLSEQFNACCRHTNCSLFNAAGATPRVLFSAFVAKEQMKIGYQQIETCNNTFGNCVLSKLDRKAGKESSKTKQTRLDSRDSWHLHLLPGANLVVTAAGAQLHHRLTQGPLGKALLAAQTSLQSITSMRQGCELLHDETLLEEGGIATSAQNDYRHEVGDENYSSTAILHLTPKGHVSGCKLQQARVARPAGQPPCATFSTGKTV